MRPKTVEDALKVWVATARQQNERIRQLVLEALHTGEQRQDVKGPTSDSKPNEVVQRPPR